MNQNVASSEITLTEELILVLLNEHTGYIELSPGWKLSSIVAGSVLADLALGGRIDTDLEALYLVDSTPTESELLDQVIRDIQQSDETHDTQYWVERITSYSDEFISNSFDILVDKNILLRDIGGFFRLNPKIARSGFSDVDDSPSNQDAKARIMDVIFSETLPDPRDAILISLIHASDMFKVLIQPDDFDESTVKRIELLSKLDLIGRTVGQAVQTTSLLPRHLLYATGTKPIPKLQLRDILRNRHLFDGNLPKAMSELHSKFGPIVKTPFKMRNCPLYIAMGAGTNYWINKNARFYLRSKEYLGGLDEAYDSAVSLLTLDGASHFKMRRAFKYPYSRAALAERLPDLFHHCRESTRPWTKGKVIPLWDAFQENFISQFGNLAVNVDYSHIAHQIEAYHYRSLYTNVMEVLPKFMLRTPKMKRYKECVYEFQDLIISSHTPAQRKGKPADIADQLIALRQSDPLLMSEADFTMSLCGTINLAMYLSSGLAFAVYCIMKNPEVHQRVYKEAESIFGNGRVPRKEDFSLANTDVTHRLLLESIRLFPVVPLQLRAVVNQLNYDGYIVPSGSFLITATSASQFDGSIFKDPNKFDIDRFLPERSEHTYPGAFMPFGLGPHTCPGRRYASFSLLVNLMLIVYHYELELVSQDKKTKLKPIPFCRLRKKYKMRVRRIRNPLPSV